MMIKRLILLVAAVFSIGFADEYLIKVNLIENRLAPFAEKGLKIVAELENIAIILIDEIDLNNILPHTYQILDQKPEEGQYYLIHPIDTTIDPSKYGEILTRDENDYLLKIREGMLEELIKEKVMLRRLSFRPIIFKSETTPPRCLFNVAVQGIVNQVNPDTILSYVERLQDFVTRYSTHDSCFAAANYIVNKFYDYGCDSVFLQYHTGDHAPNVIGVKHGVTYPDSIYAVICGHFDATSSAIPDTAPGADDNASGTAGVIEATRVMQGYDFEYSIRYIAFSGEEFGLWGSEYYAALARSEGDSILGVLNADMIAYADFQPESVEVIAKISNPPCGPFADFFISAADTYTTLLTTKRMVNSMPYSDHDAFWQQGYIALLNIEDWRTQWPHIPNPYYHTPGDTIGAGYNDNDFCTEVIKAEVAALSLLAVPHETGVDEFVDTKSEGVRIKVYPNIGNSYFNISFETNNGDKEFSLQIYDVAGKLVKDLSANNPVIWNGSDNSNKKLPSGIYFVQSKTDDYQIIAKIILIR